MQRIVSTNDEPMLNLLGHSRAGRFTVILFPRAAHRPACYFADGPEKLSVSPAILEMCGLLVTTHRDDFERIDAGIARAIYEEVSVQPDQFQHLANTL
jgi:hypothetical protein